MFDEPATRRAEGTPNRGNRSRDRRRPASRALRLCIAFVLAGASVGARADTVDARCDIYPAGEDHAAAMVPCRFSQRQGYVTITRDDGVVHELSPTGDIPGNFVDGSGAPVYRRSGLGDDGLIFRLPTESVYVYWNTAALTGGGDNPTAPYSTTEFDATTLLPCSTGVPNYVFECPAGIRRGEPGFAEIRVQSPDRGERVLQFEPDAIAAPDATLIDGTKIGDEWLIVIDDREYYRIPEAAITGG